MSEKIYSEGVEKIVGYGPLDNSANALLGNLGVGGQAFNPQANQQYQAIGKSFEPVSLLHELRNRKARIALQIDANESETKRLWAEHKELDKAIAALEPSSGGLLDDQPEAASPEVASEQGGPREETKAFVRDVLENTFGQQTTDEQVRDVASELDALVFDAHTIAERTSVVTDQDRVDPSYESSSQASSTDAPLLWCMHELAQDELYAAPSFEEAAAVADWANETFKQRDENDPRMRFQIEHWPYSAEAHAAGLMEWAKGWATKRNGEPIDWINNPPKAEPRAIAEPSETLSESDSQETAPATIEQSQTEVTHPDALMWSNGFQADAKARNEAEQEPEAKRPFWMFAKSKVDA